MSQELHCAAVDLGATSGRVIVGAWSAGKLELTEVHRFPNQFRSIGTHDYWDMPGLWAEVCMGLRKAIAQFPALASVGVDTWGVDHVLLDARGQLVYPTHAYRDARTQPGLKRLQDNPDDLAAVYEATGIPNVFYNASLQLEAAVSAHPGIKDLAERCLFLPDYFNFLLSGRMANELTIGSTSQLLDVRKPTWSATALARFGVPAKWFAEPTMPGTKLGPVTGIEGMERVEVVAVPGHDTACAYDAMPAAPDGGDLYLSSGTWSLVGFESHEPLLGADALAAGISNERTGDGHWRPLTNIIGLWLLEGIMKDFATRPQSGAEWAVLIDAAERLPSPTALLDVSDPAFSNPPSMREAIDAQLTARCLEIPADLAGYTRLICESLGASQAAALHRFQKLAKREFKRILIVGGGSKNRILCQSTADAAGVPVVSLEVEGSAVGSIARQLIALGAVTDLATFRAEFGRHLNQTLYTPRS